MASNFLSFGVCSESWEIMSVDGRCWGVGGNDDDDGGVIRTVACQLGSNCRLLSLTVAPAAPEIAVAALSWQRQPQFTPDGSASGDFQESRKLPPNSLTRHLSHTHTSVTVLSGSRTRVHQSVQHDCRRRHSQCSAKSPQMFIRAHPHTNAPPKL